MSDNHTDRVKEELERRRKARKVRDEFRAQQDARRNAYRSERDATLAQLSDRLQISIYNATDLPVEIQLIKSDAPLEQWEKLESPDDAVTVCFYKQMFDYVVRKSIAEIRLPLSRYDNRGLQAVVLDRRKPGPATVLNGAHTTDQAVSEVVDLTVDALANAIEAGCEIISPIEGARRIEEQRERERASEHTDSEPPPAAAPPTERDWTPAIWLTLLAALVLLSVLSKT